MSAAWDGIANEQYDSRKAKRALRLWGYLCLAGTFLTYVCVHLNISLF